MGAQASTESQRKPHFTFIWAIENGSELPVNGYLESPRFIAYPIEKTVWKIANKVLFNGAIELAIQREDNGPDSIQIEFELSILDADGSTLRMQTSEKEFKCKDEACLKLFDDEHEVFTQRRAEFLPNDTYTICCRMWRTGIEMPIPDTCFARTRLGLDRRCFVWAIRKLSNLRLKQKTTPFINTASKGSPELILSLFLSETNGKNYLNIQIEQNSAIRDHIFICKFSILDIDCRVVYSKKFYSFIQVDFPKVFTCREFFEKDKLVSSLLPNDVLSLRCEFQIDADLAWSRIETYRCLDLEDLERIKTELPKRQLDETVGSSNDCCSFKKAFKDLYEIECCNDVKLRAGTKLFPAHKAILSIRSPVFKAMFTQNMDEKTSQIVDVPDMNHDTLDRLLQYIYTGTVQELQWESAIDLFIAADKHQLLDLRNKCSFFLKSNLSVTNVCSILSLAYMHEDSHFRVAVENFISEHDIEIFNSEKWKKFKEGKFSLALEVTERVIYLIKRKHYFASLWS
ncbi:Protein roadkill like protein [Argiope bruennichi]|uniref:Protein roadkill like protein n=1 Tax=Argiope bruennichi TaxID=94029 RepID=A0A8T0EFX4_ARGBR|nr:Protein roadkill like protein [Argiope bruennichi]